MLLKASFVYVFTQKQLCVCICNVNVGHGLLALYWDCHYELTCVPTGYSQYVHRPGWYDFCYFLFNGACGHWTCRCVTYWSGIFHTILGHANDVVLISCLAFLASATGRARFCARQSNFWGGNELISSICCLRCNLGILATVYDDRVV